MSFDPDQTSVDILLKDRTEIDAKVRAQRAGMTILFTDMVGSTAYTHEFGDRAALKLKYRHETIAKAAIASFGGEVLKTIGDSVMALFQQSSAAVQAAVKIQRSLSEDNLGHPEKEQFQLRIGLHCGIALLLNETKGIDVSGDVVNVAARVLKNCHPEQILISLAVREAIRTTQGLRTRPAGKVPFHGKPDQEEVFEVIWDQRPDIQRERSTPPSRVWKTLTIVSLVSLLVGALASLLYWSKLHYEASPATLVLVGDFENSTGQGDLDGLREQFLIRLRRSTRIRLLSPDQISDVRKRMKNTVSPINENIGLEMCRRDGIPLLLAGAIGRSGDVFQVSIRGFQPDQDRHQPIAETESFKNAGDVFVALDKLAQKTLRSLEESSAAISAPVPALERVTTPSFSALEQYSKAMQALAHGEDGQVLGLLTTALDLDQDFAMAHLRLARYYSVFEGNGSAATEEVNTAYSLRTDLSQREQWWIEGYYRSLSEDYQGAQASFTKVVSLYPDDLDAHYELAVAHDNAGQIEEAIREFRLVLELNPKAGSIYQRLPSVPT